MRNVRLLRLLQLRLRCCSLGSKVAHDLINSRVVVVVLLTDLRGWWVSYEAHVPGWIGAVPGCMDGELSDGCGLLAHPSKISCFPHYS